MTKTILALAVAFAAPAFANELDQVTQAPTAEMKQLAKDLPGTVVVRTNKQTGEVEVVQVKEQLAKGDKSAEKMKFSKVAVNAENSGLEVHSGNELDATSSTSSWSFGFYGYGRPAWGGSYGYRGWNNVGWGANYYPRYNPYYAAAYYPSYSYAGYAYNYAPYYTWSTPIYDYSYCNWY